MTAAPITATAAFVSDLDPGEALARLRQIPFGTRLTLEQPTTSALVVRSGSRLRYRLLGVWMDGRHLPMRLRFDAEPAPGGTSIRLTMTSDEGWYLVQTSLGKAAYGNRFAQLLRTIEAAGFAPADRTQPR